MNPQQKQDQNLNFCTILDLVPQRTIIVQVIVADA